MPARDPAAVVQRQLDAYNAHDLAAFVACYAEDVAAWRMPAAAPALTGRAALAAFYGAERFNRPGLRADLLGRLVVGGKVIDHELIVGLDATPRAAVAVYAVGAEGLIATAWFFDAS
jgi:hypothetical protein